MRSYTYEERIAALRKTKMDRTQEKWRVRGAMDFDDHAIVLPPAESRKIVEVVSGSGISITDALFKEFKPKSKHPSGGFFGPKACGENFKALLERHPVYIDPMSSLAGAYMTNFMSYRQPFWNPDFDYSHLQDEQQKYKVHHGIGAVQHFCQDLKIGFDLGWGGIMAKIHRFRKINTSSRARDFYDGLEAVDARHA